MRRTIAAFALALALAGGSGVAQADPHDPERSGHPLRVTAYLLHPVGVVLDTLIFRPAHWLVHRHRSIETLFGHQD